MSRAISVRLPEKLASVNLRLKQLRRQSRKHSNRILMLYLATKGDLENGLENLEVRLSGKITLLQWMLAIVIAAEVLPFFFYKAL